ncbi:hypothetical protein [Robertmurraya sp. P23]|uniref:hypothetical protein n=1 Tax=Robertmurraya sp. P23 TaxID=3436931 RepID=UPI003D992497
MNVRYLGALGFGIGGLVVGLSGDYFIFAIFFMGLIGSAMLSIPARSIKFTILTSLLGAFGFVIGFTIPMFISMSIFDLSLPIVGVIMGLISGALLGIIFKNIKSFSLYGMIGFGLWGLLINIFRPIYDNIPPALITLIASAVAGIMLGHAALLSRRVRK